MRYTFSLIASILFIQAGIAQQPKSAKATVKAPNKNAEKLEYDTTYKGWVEYLPGEFVDNSHFADKQGNLYAIAILPEGRRAVKLVNGKWENIQNGLSEEPSWFFGDPTGNVYLRTGDVFHKFVSGRWEKLFDNKYLAFTNISFGNDGRLYGHAPVIVKPTHFSLMVYQNGNWNYIGKEQFLSNRVHREVDKAGNVYLAYDITSNAYSSGNQVFNIKKWDGSAWSSLASNIGHVRTMFICKEELYIQVNNGGAYTLSKWSREMQNWKPVYIPVNIHSNEYWASNNNEILRVRGRNVEDNSILLIYELRDGKWIQVAKWTDGKPFQGYNHHFMSVANSLVTLTNKKIFRFDNTPATIQSRNVASIQLVPLNDVDRSDPIIAKSYNQVGIFSEKGKKGLRDKSGKIIVHPVFDEISIEKAPWTYSEEERHRYAYRLKSSEANILCAYAVTGPDQLEGFIDSVTPCQSCKGEGKSKDSTVKTYVPGEWVPEQKITTTTPTTSRNSERTWNPNKNQYEDKRTVTQGSTTSTTVKPGYHKKGTYKTEIIKGSICSACKGNSLKIVRNYYVFNSNSGKYELKQEVFMKSKTK